MLQTRVHLYRRMAGLQLVASLGNLPLTAVICGALTTVVCDALRQVVGGSGGGVLVDAPGMLMSIVCKPETFALEDYTFPATVSSEVHGDKASPLSSSQQ